MTDFFTRPILNSPYEYPSRHWQLDETGQPTGHLVDRRRRAEFITAVPKPKKQRAGQRAIVFRTRRGYRPRRSSTIRPRSSTSCARGSTPGAPSPTRPARSTPAPAPGSKQFTRGFLVVAPGITIRDRLRVLQPRDPDSYYRRCSPS